MDRMVTQTERGSTMPATFNTIRSDTLLPNSHEVLERLKVWDELRRVRDDAWRMGHVTQIEAGYALLAYGQDAVTGRSIRHAIVAQADPISGLGVAISIDPSKLILDEPDPSFDQLNRVRLGGSSQRSTAPRIGINFADLTEALSRLNGQPYTPPDTSSDTMINSFYPFAIFGADSAPQALGNFLTDYIKRADYVTTPLAARLLGLPSLALS